ncbi:hypothetical protein Y032_0110g161 [Ancylostoma ceylanicum]|uniref:Uncharacterized protein n=2 Tax=Ancylostoma ceylanicum TaxID=53326 RepID=A0A016TES7_9BILA|nr:hypothetical protein Y032_0110g161 [Ancylostoma ceylanicum]
MRVRIPSDGLSRVHYSEASLCHLISTMVPPTVSTGIGEGVFSRSCTLTVRAHFQDHKKYKKMSGVCQVVFVYPKGYENCGAEKGKAKPLYDIVLRNSYLPEKVVTKTKPFCVIGNLSTFCFCRGNSCFASLWDVVQYLVEMYRSDNVELAKSFKTKSYFDDFHWEQDYRAVILYCLITEIRNKKFEALLPAVPNPKSSKDAKAWKKFDDAVKKLPPPPPPPAEKKDDETTKNGKKSKKKERLIWVIMIMGGLNAISLFIIICFFLWYRGFARGDRGKDAAAAEPKEGAEQGSSDSKGEKGGTPGDASPIAGTPVAPGAPGAPGPAGPAAPGPVPPSAPGPDAPPPPPQPPGMPGGPPPAPRAPDLPPDAPQPQWPATY